MTPLSHLKSQSILITLRLIHFEGLKHFDQLMGVNSKTAELIQRLLAPKLALIESESNHSITLING